MAEMVITSNENTGIKEAVYGSLLESTNQIEAQVFEVNRLKQEAARALHPEELDAKIMAASHAVETLKKEARRSAHALVKEYERRERAKDELDPSELTEDMRLLQSGIKLTERDITSMLNRAEGNRTMTQAILRYAKDNGIETGGSRYVGFELRPDGKQLVDDLNDAIDLYVYNHASTPRARVMLDGFFGITYKT